MIAGLNLKDAGEWEWMAAIRELRAKDLHAWMEHPQANRRGVLVDPILRRERESSRLFCEPRLSCTYIFRGNQPLKSQQVSKHKRKTWLKV